MNDKHDTGEALTFLDMLFSMLIFYNMLLVLALASMNIDATKKNAVEVKAEYMITVTWSDADTYQCDIDTHVQDPSGRRVWYQSKQDGLMHLDRDDVGPEHTGDGKLNYTENREIVTLRGYSQGEYIVNVHGFSLFDYKTNEYLENVPVRVMIQKINPTVTLVFDREVIVKTSGSEETVVRFTLDRDGNITSTNFLPLKMVNSWQPPRSS